MSRKSETLLIVAVGMGLVTLAIGPPLTAGELEPPGSPASTMKDLDEVAPGTPINEIPFTITESGFYYLTESWTMSSSTHAIDVDASDVTIDLMGFTLDGNGLGTIGIDLSQVDNVEVRNGTITAFTDSGLYVNPAVGGDYHRAIDLRVSASINCIFLDGVASIMQGNTVWDCSGFGIEGGWQSWVVGNNISAGTGIFVQGESTVDDNIVSADTGIATNQTGTKIRNNTVNAGYGIRVALDSFVEGNQVTGFGSSGVGIEANSPNVIQNNSAFAAEAGAKCFDFYGAGNFYADNRARTCTTAYDENSLNQRDGGGNWDGTVP